MTSFDLIILKINADKFETQVTFFPLNIMSNSYFLFFFPVEIRLKNEYYVIGGGSEATFKASRIIFHWGKCNISHDGSEHSIDGQKYPLEVMNIINLITL